MLERMPSWGRASLTGAVILTVPLWLRDPYHLHLAITIAMFSIATLGARLLLVLGLWSFGQGVFLTIGAYTSAILVVDLGLSFWAALPVVALGGAVAGALTLAAIETIGFTYLGEVANLFIYLLVLVVLLVRPQGLFARA